MPVGIFLPRREPRYTQGLPIQDSANSPRRSLFAGLLLFGLSIADPTRRIGIGLHGTALGTETPCPGLSRFTLGKRVDIRLLGKLRSWRSGFGVWDLLYGPRKRA